MGMSNYILTIEEKCFDQVGDMIGDCEHVSEAMARAIEIFRKENMLGYMSKEDIEDSVAEMWNEFWSKHL